MDSLKDLNRLISDASDALKAAGAILADETLPIAARLKAYDLSLIHI